MTPQSIATALAASLRITNPTWQREGERDTLSMGVHAALFLGFFGLYSVLGWSVLEQGYYSMVDVFFGADVRWMIGDLTDFSANHYRTNTHPLMVLMLNPMGLLLNAFTPSADVTGLLMTAAAGACSVVAAALFFLQLGLRRLEALLGAVLLGASAGHVIWGAVPDAYLLDGFTLMLFFWAVLAHPGKPWVVLATALLAFGMLTTNLPPLVLIFVVARNGLRWRPLAMLRDAFRFTAIVLGCSFVLAVVQDLIYPSATFFFMPHAVGTRVEYIGSSLMDKPDVLLLYMFVFSIIAPLAAASTLEGGQTGLRVALESDFLELFSPVNLAFLMLWAVAMACLLFQSAKLRWDREALPATMGLCIAFNFVLHMVYGRPSEYYLYVPHWSFLLVGLVCLALHSVGTASPRALVGVRVFLSLLAALALIGNIAAFQQMMSILRGPG